ncbi:MAG: hypothetical protein ACJ8GN_04640 [Longimicrobiaceae bacterium]
MPSYDHPDSFSNPVSLVCPNAPKIQMRFRLGPETGKGNVGDGHRKAEKVLRPVDGVEEVQVVGAISQIVAEYLGLATTARSVWLHPGVVEHIRGQRGLTRDDADFVLSRIPPTVIRPHYCGPDPRWEGRFDLIHVPDDAARPVFVAIKLVHAVDERSTDEIWISTAYPLSGNFMSRKRFKDSLRRLPWV